MTSSLTSVDWTTIPAPEDDGALDHLTGRAMPALQLASTAGGTVDLSQAKGRVVVYAYPRTGEPGKMPPPEWDSIPGARGCTPQSCSFRDHHAELEQLGVAAVYGLSTQDTEYQREAVDRLHLPFAILSDQNLKLTEALGLPTFGFNGMTLMKRFALILKDGAIEKVFYPVFPPDRSAADVVEWLQANLQG